MLPPSFKTQVSIIDWNGKFSSHQAQSSYLRLYASHNNSSSVEKLQELRPLYDIKTTDVRLSRNKLH